MQENYVSLFCPSSVETRSIVLFSSGQLDYLYSCCQQYHILLTFCQQYYILLIGACFMLAPINRQCHLTIVYSSPRWRKLFIGSSLFHLHLCCCLGSLFIHAYTHAYIFVVSVHIWMSLIFCILKLPKLCSVY